MAPLTFSRRFAIPVYGPLEIGLIAGSAVLLALLCFLGFYLFTRKKRITEGSADLTGVEGAARPVLMTDTPLLHSIPHSPSQYRLAPSIAMPEKSYTREPSSPCSSEEAVAWSQHKPSSTSFVSTFQHPPSNVSYSTPLSRARSNFNSSSSRHSRSSSGFTAYASYFLPPGLYSRPSSSMSAACSQSRSVRQLFEATLHDELSIERYGEHLTVLRSFDDGWCLVARDTSRRSLFSRASRVSTWLMSNSDNIDMGLVPEWVFVKPLKGITVTRPFRMDSINALQLCQSSALHGGYTISESYAM